MWQDKVMSLASVLFAYALIPQIFHSIKNKYVDIKLQTIIITTIGLVLLIISTGTLNFIYATVVNLITFSCWSILLILKLKYGEKYVRKKY